MSTQSTDRSGQVLVPGEGVRRRNTLDHVGALQRRRPADLRGGLSGIQSALRDDDGAGAGDHEPPETKSDHGQRLHENSIETPLLNNYMYLSYKASQLAGRPVFDRVSATQSVGRFRLTRVTGRSVMAATRWTGPLSFGRSASNLARHALIQIAMFGVSVGLNNIASDLEPAPRAWVSASSARRSARCGSGRRRSGSR